MKKTLALILALVIVFAISTVFVSAADLPANKQAVVDACKALKSGNAAVEPAYINQVISFLEKAGADDCTKEISDAAIANVKKVQEIINKEAGKQPEKYSEANKTEIKSLISDTALLFDCVCIYDNTSKNLTVYNSTKFAQIAEVDVTDAAAIKAAVEAIEKAGVTSEIVTKYAEAKVDEVKVDSDKTFEPTGFSVNWIWFAVIAVAVVAGGAFVFRKIKN